MSHRTIAVELENGFVRPSGLDILPAKARALLTLLDESAPAPALTCAELSERWNGLGKLSADEGAAFAEDIENSRASLPPLNPKWD